MLGMKSYPKEYIDGCRAKVEADVRAFQKAGSKELEGTFFNNMVVKLQYMFEHRLSGTEGKDGNPLNEVRVLCNSILLNHGKLQVEKLPTWPNSAVAGLTLPPETSVLRLEPGDEIRLNAEQFARLSRAFFGELEKKYA